MTALIMPSDYGMEMLVGSSPVLGSSFLGSSSFYDYNRCAPMWNHAPTSSCLSEPVTTIAAKPITHGSPFSVAVNSVFDDGSPCNDTEPPNYFSSRTGCARRSVRNSTRRRKLATVEAPLQLQQQCLKSCLVRVSKTEEPMPDGAVSPTKEKKKVSFADIMGGNLTHIKIITERPDCPPRWSQDFLEQLTGGAKAEAISNGWALAFSQPAADYMSWKFKLERDSVALENVVIKEAENQLAGTVKVRNISFTKLVIVRYTSTNWLCHDDATAEYVSTPASGSSYNIYDTFTFQVPLPDTSIADKLEFCISYETDGIQFWDNNNDKNYAVVSFKSKKSDANDKPSDLYDVRMDSWSEFSAWNNLKSSSSPYW